MTDCNCDTCQMVERIRTAAEQKKMQYGGSDELYAMGIVGMANYVLNLLDGKTYGEELH